jgi:flagellar motor switch protein FliN/FliY
MNAMTPGGLEADALEAPLPMKAPEAGLDAAALGVFGGISVRLAVEVGSIRLPLRDLLALAAGDVHVLDRRVDAPVDVLINDRLVARGEIVSVGEQFGVKLVEILPGAAA